MLLLITCPFGLSSTLSNELKRHDFQPFDQRETGCFVKTDLEGMYKINLISQIASKVHLVLYQEKNVQSTINFDQLFDKVHTLDRATYIKPGYGINVTVHTRQSRLESAPSCQSIIQKAIYKKLCASTEGITNDQRPVNEPETINPICFLHKDKLIVTLNSSGKSLHQQGRRDNTGDATLKENLATGLLHIAGRSPSYPLTDPFCGSGTILIQAARIKAGKSNSKRNFGFQYFKNYEKNLFDGLHVQLTNNETNDNDKSIKLEGYDIDPTTITKAQRNAQNANIHEDITFHHQDILTRQPEKTDRMHFIITNPPYDKRLKSEDIIEVYKKLINIFETHHFKGGFLSGRDGVMQLIDNKKRKKKPLYNGPDKVYFFRYIGS